MKKQKILYKHTRRRRESSKRKREKQKARHRAFVDVRGTETIGAVVFVTKAKPMVDDEV